MSEEFDYTDDNAREDIIANFDKFVAQVQYLQCKLIESGFADAYAQANGSCAKSGFEIRGIERGGICISAEYNDACSCHPEYQTETFVIPWEAIKAAFADYKNAIASVQEKNEERMREESERAAREAEARAARAIQADMEQYARLRARFEYQQGS